MLKVISILGVESKSSHNNFINSNKNKTMFMVANKVHIQRDGM